MDQPDPTDSTASRPGVPSGAVSLEGGGRMPLLGFGTWQLKGEDATSATAAALAAGYRHVDTATIYGNEAEVGRAVQESGIGRDDLFVTTKCPPDQLGHELETLERSLDLLGTEYVDLWLIHWPAGNDGSLAMWRAFGEARERGLAQDVGVSNFDVTMLDELAARTGVKPAVNQVKWSPFLFDREVLDQHRERGVVLEGYSGLRGGTLDDPAITGIAERLGRTPAQVILRWHLQHGVVAIPKSSSAERIRSNADLTGFVLSDEDMTALDSLSRRS
jgi:2,5-diketo-D-gluconate reductase A